MRYLVFGGSGFIGSNLIEELTENGNEATIFDWLPDPEGLEVVKNRNVAVVRGNITNFHEVVSAMKVHAPDYIVNLVSLMSNAPKINDERNSPWPALEVHSKGMFNILEACRAIPVKRILWASSVAVYGASNSPIPWNEDTLCAPDTVYGIAKRLNEFMGEYYLQRFGISSVGLRFPFVYGPRMFRVRSGGKKSAMLEFIEDLLTQGMITDKVTVFGLKRIQDWFYVRDAARSIILASVSSSLTSRVYQMSGQRRQAAEIVDIVKKLVPNLSIEILDKGNENAGRLGGAHYDSTRAKNDFRFEPKYSIEEGIRLTMEYYKKILWRGT